MDKHHARMWRICQIASNFCLSQAAKVGIRNSMPLQLSKYMENEQIGIVKNLNGVSFCTMNETTLVLLTRQCMPFYEAYGWSNRQQV